MTGAANLGIAIGDGAVITRTLNIAAGLRAEHATVSLDITHGNWGDLTVELISPAGTVSKLVANPKPNAVFDPDMLIRRLSARKSRRWRDGESLSTCVSDDWRKAA